MMKNWMLPESENLDDIFHQVLSYVQYIQYVLSNSTDNNKDKGVSCGIHSSNLLVMTQDVIKRGKIRLISVASPPAVSGQPIKSMAWQVHSRIRNDKY